MVGREPACSEPGCALLFILHEFISLWHSLDKIFRKPLWATVEEMENDRETPRGCDSEEGRLRRSLPFTSIPGAPFCSVPEKPAFGLNTEVYFLDLGAQLSHVPTSVKTVSDVLFFLKIL